MENIEHRIAEIKKAAEHNRLNYEFVKDYRLSLVYPTGQIEWFKKRLFELQQQISKDTIFGDCWSGYNFNNNIFETDWIEKVINIAPKHMNEDEVWRQLVVFTRQYLNLLDYQDYIKKNETKYAEKYYAWYHKILIKLGKADKFADDISKVEIMNFGKHLYGLKGTG